MFYFILVKVEEGEIIEDVEVQKDVNKKDSTVEGTVGAGTVNLNDRKPQQTGWLRRGDNQSPAKMVK